MLCAYSMKQSPSCCDCFAGLGVKQCAILNHAQFARIACGNQFRVWLICYNTEIDLCETSPSAFGGVGGSSNELTKSRRQQVKTKKDSSNNIMVLASRALLAATAVVAFASATELRVSCFTLPTSLGPPPSLLRVAISIGKQ